MHVWHMMSVHLQRIGTYKGLILHGTPPDQAAVEATVAAQNTQVSARFSSHPLLLVLQEP